MLSNSDIKKQLETEVVNAFSDFESTNENSDLVDGFEKLRTFDFDTYKSKLKEEIKSNLTAVWTNTAKGIDPSQKLDAILLEHYMPDQLGLEAYAYGIIEWDEKEMDGVEVDMGWNYDFADGLEQNDGITLDYFNPYIDYLDLDDESELVRCYKAKGALVIHEVFMELHQEKTFDAINKNDEFYFLLGEHDIECTAILSISSK